jgi:hypothetical protein
MKLILRGSIEVKLISSSLAIEQQLDTPLHKLHLSLVDSMIIGGVQLLS